MKLQVKPNTHPVYNKHRFNLVDGQTEIAYSNNRLMAHIARIEIERTLNFQPKRLTQADIDFRNPEVEPQGIVRRLLWRAARRD